ncbi:NAD+ synthase (glutamine-hydrolysing) [Mariprofundus aestuarium]|uniref:Glutamine-dependent NAD(+) synthetase n=1 Tax=Mariprofundus aestuarium TaxID=1921086 RepID=A0A2K8KWF7_MARES|nr:NAD+ synthase [Mariprofundus aestuarium]ATX79188.1 NAD+ synthase (glutamine-hydrolysing) [Mariprofundus aestuarium]
MKVYIAQIAPRVGDLDGNVRLIHEVLAKAEAGGCDLAVFPELTVTGYPPEDLLKRPAFMDAVEKAVGRVVESTGSVCAVFGAPRREGSQLRNSVLLTQNGKLIGVYDKQRLPNYGVFDEQRYFSAGDGSCSLMEVNGYRVGVGICEDLWHDDLAKVQAEMDCDLWLNLNASPFHLGKQLQREALVARRAIQFTVPVVYVNPVGGQDEVVFDGGSHVADSQGKLLFRAPMFEPWCGIVNLGSVRREPLTPLPEDLEQVYKALVLGVADYVHRNGCKQVVIGLSGGIDSALTAAIAVEALGAENVLGVLLPSHYSSDHSLIDAEALVSNLSMESITLPIANGVDVIEQILSDTFASWGKSEPDLTEENVQARIRGVLLMAISNKTGRMVLTTGNKSEMAVGYATLYGDMAGGFAVLKDVYKTQVFALSRWINRDVERIPENTITKPPSAELRPDQKDSDSLPDYEVLDAILAAHIEERLGVEEIAARGYDVAEVKRVVRMLQLAEYKRRQSPPGVKITERAFGRDRRYPITHGFWE